MNAIKTKSFSLRSRAVISLGVALFVLITIAWIMMAGATGARAQTERRIRLGFGPMQICRKQAALVSVALPLTTPPTPTRVVMVILDMIGNEITRKDIYVEPGHTSVLSLIVPGGTWAEESRTIRAEILVFSDQPTVSTFSIVEMGTGRMQAVNASPTLIEALP